MKIKSGLHHKIQGYPDYGLFSLSVVILILGVLILASVSASYSQRIYGNTYYFLRHQLLYGLIPGIILGFLVFKIPLSVIKKWSFALLLINLFLVALVFIPRIGFSAKGASRWLNLGPFSFQPTEFLKLTFILYLASWLESFFGKISPKNKKNLNGLKIGLVAFMALLGIVGFFLIFQPDIGTLGIIVLTAIAMYFSAKTPLWHSILIILIAILALIILMTSASYRLNRILVFLNPEFEPMGRGYQLKQSLIAIGSGGVFGLGLGMSLQKFGFLPQSISDAIFAIFSEETGFIGALILILIFLLFFLQGFKIMKRGRDNFSQLATLGIIFWICLQAFVNIGSMTGILPLTGIPLPFVSYGGSHLLSELAGLGILLNISKNVNS